jgi:phage-related protein
MIKIVEIKPIIWVASTKKDIQKLPEDVKDTFGFALHQAQAGDKHLNAKPLKGYSGAGILEVVEDFEGNAY